MTSVRSYRIDKERGIQEIQAGIEDIRHDFPVVEERVNAGINEIQAERAEFERRHSRDVENKQKDADEFAEDFWEGD